MRSARSSVFLIVFVLACVGIVKIYSASAIYSYSNTGDSLFYQKRHLMYLAIGYLLMFVAMSVDLAAVQRLAKPLSKIGRECLSPMKKSVYALLMPLQCLFLMCAYRT